MTVPMPFLERLRNKEFPRLEYVKRILSNARQQAQLSQALKEEQTVVAAKIIRDDYKRGERE